MPKPFQGEIKLRHLLGIEFIKERIGEYREGLGPAKPYIDNQAVGEDESHKVVFDIADDAYVDVEAHLAAAMARD